MRKHHPANESIKRQYLTFLREAKRHSEPTVDTVAKVLSRFEEYTGYRDFKTFRYEQAVAFKKHLAQQRAQRSGQRLSSATLHATQTQLNHFFQWLSWQPGYRSRIQYANAEYFNLSEKEVRVAIARREQKAPTIEQIKHVIDAMPAVTDIERRNRALIAVMILTGCPGQCHCLPEAQTCRSRRKLHLPGRTGGQGEVQQDPHHLLLSRRSRISIDLGELGRLSPRKEVMGQR